ncbi:unnamed protein product [Pedinophyceae sp. YPF-701]|nr:unnamed protein product [Pedinophyceae sp. YPF-701]
MAQTALKNVGDALAKYPAVTAVGLAGLFTNYLPWNEEFVLAMTFVAFVETGRRFAGPSFSKMLADQQDKAKNALLSTKPWRVTAPKAIMSEMMTESNTLAQYVGRPAPLKWAPPPRSSGALLNFTSRHITAQKDPFAGVKVPASWGWFARLGEEVPLGARAAMK